MITYTLKVTDLCYESSDAVTISFKQPALKKVKFRPGQYLTVIVNINNRKYKRPYSLSSAPGIDSRLSITVKRLAHGIVSNHLIDIVKVGDLLEVIEPMGDFVYNPDIHHNQEVFLWGAGSGITPLMSILKTVLSSGEQKISLFYCNKSLNQTIFHDQLVQLKNQYSSRFAIFLFFTEEFVAGTKQGRIGAEDVHKGLNNVADINNTIHYICGPSGLKETVKSKLAEKGLKKNQIFSEDFEHTVNEAEIKEIQTQFVKIISKDATVTIEVVRGKSILEAGLDSQIDLPYSCQTGSCTLCKAKLIAGQVKIISNEIADHDLVEDERLLCCSYPLTDNVIFEIN